MTLVVCRFAKDCAVVAIASSAIAICIAIEIHHSRDALANGIAAHVIADDTTATTVSARENREFVIDGGTQAGTHLFHSFDQFSVPTSGSVHFNNHPDIGIIFSRITGGRGSEIDGQISANGVADLFLINPSGIVFGANAQLDIGGSFIATTAETVLFEDAQFSATTVSSPPLLTMSAPVGLQFGTSSQDIHYADSGHTFERDSFLDSLESLEPFTGLEVLPEQTLALVAQNIQLTGGILTANGHLELGAIDTPRNSSRSPGIQSQTVGLQSTDTGWGFDYGSIHRFGVIQMSHKAVVDGSGPTSGSLHLQGQTLGLVGSSVILMDNTGRSSDVGIDLDFSETIRLGETLERKVPSGIYSYTSGRGSSAPIRITTGRLQLIRGGFIGSQTFSPFRSGNAGLINIHANQVDFWAGDQLVPLSDERAGVIMSRTFDRGSAGDIHLNVRQLRMFNAGAITANVNVGARGTGGRVYINASERVELAGTANTIPGSLLIGASSLGYGNAQGIVINTPRLIMGPGSRISASAFANGNAGSIEINASASITLDSDTPSLPQQSTDSFTGIQSATLQLERSLREQLVTSHGRKLPVTPTGAAGMVIVNTPYLEVNDASRVSVQNDGVGNAGDIAILADTLFLQNQGELTATTASGAGGNIDLAVRDLLLLKQQGLINTEAGGDGNGGNIQIDALHIIGIDNSDIVATAIKGSGGNIQITTQGLFGLDVSASRTSGNDITASSNLGVNGRVQVTTPAVDPSLDRGGLSVLGLDPHEQIATRCGVTRGSRFRVVGRGGLPVGPEPAVSHARPWHSTLPDFGQISPLDATVRRANTLGRNSLVPATDIALDPASQSFSAETADPIPPAQPIWEATGMAIAPNGSLQLVATHDPHISIPHANCASPLDIS